MDVHSTITNFLIEGKEIKCPLESKFLAAFLRSVILSRTFHRVVERLLRGSTYHIVRELQNSFLHITPDQSGIKEIPSCHFYVRCLCETDMRTSTPVNFH